MKDYLYDDREVALLGTFVPASGILSAGTFAGSSPARAELSPRGPYRQWGKRALDILLVLLTLPLSLPVILGCALILWVQEGRPFYRQDRLGENGETFSILKLRTMVVDADRRLEAYLAENPDMRAEWDATQKLKNDPRVTMTGRFLRATSLDELPQLWNVLMGDMSLVGPRPMMPDQLSLYGDARPYFAMKPGITGIWQVSARNENRFDYRATVDARYFLSLSLAKDVGILFKTVGVVLRRTGY
ncbi:sugar transferase [Thalassococcus sp. S3]|uniref:sugar transferase n=1 Tax=Thalassococcus sp. S3 TaxID=2017482 RepID=UPI0010247FC3|nr:sugar transferase [Thalassococcus sp. S3]QBF31993.1 sugar transferase [Thalassococcus sp. S3]